MCNIVHDYTYYRTDYYLASNSLYYVSADFPRFTHVTLVSEDPEAIYYEWEDKEIVGRVVCEDPIRYIDFVRMPFDEKQQIISRYWVLDDNQTE